LHRCNYDTLVVAPNLVEIHKNARRPAIENEAQHSDALQHLAIIESAFFDFRAYEIAYRF
jgi:hypothetical protein